MFEMHSPELVTHPFCETLKEAMPAVMHRLCRIALHLQLYAIEDYIFHAGDEGKKMFFIKSGELDYVTVAMRRPVPINPKDWLAEPVLWTAWRHRGSLQACFESELIAVDPKQFMSVMSVHPRPWNYATTYANAFIQCLNSRDDFTDICNFDGMFEHLMSKSRAAGHEDIRVSDRMSVRMEDPENLPVDTENEAENDGKADVPSPSPAVHGKPNGLLDDEDESSKLRSSDNVEEQRPGMWTSARRVWSPCPGSMLNVLR